MGTEMDPAGLRATMQRSQRFLVRQDADVQRRLQEDPPEDQTELSRHVRQLEVQSEVLRAEREKFDGLLTKYEGLTVAETDAAILQERDGWGELVHTALSSITEATIAIRDMRRPVEPTGQVQQVDAAARSQAGQDAPTTISDNFNRLIDLMERREQQGSRNVPNGASDADRNATTTSRLPKLEIAKFEGDVMKWRPFWDRFENSVDKNTKLAAVDKMNYLMSYLDGDALDVVEALPLTSENYPVAVGLLKKRFGDPKMLVAKLYRKLNEMKPVANEVKALRKFVAEIDCLLGSLGALGQNTSDDNFATIILSKLPSATVVLLEMGKNVDTDWTVTLVRDKLTDYVTRLERSDQVCADAGSAKRGGFSADGLFAGEGRKDGRKDKKGGSDKKFKPTCYFCEGDHFAAKCKKFPDAKSRIEKAKGRCLICLSPGHRKADCQKEITCRFCKKTQSHNSALCYQQFGNKQPDGESSKMAADGDGDDEKAEGSHGSESGMLAANEEVLLQTAMIPVRDAKQTLKYQKVRVLLDPGSSRSYCSQSLAKSLSLKQKAGPTLTVNHFGSSEPVEVPTKSAGLTLKKVDGSAEYIEVSVVPQVSGRLSRAAVRSKDLSRLSETLKMADSLPRTREIGPVELLIGSDYYLKFVTGQKIEVSEGLFLLGSDFGWILTGRVPRLRRDSDDTTMFCFSSYPAENVSEIRAVQSDPAFGSKPVLEDFWSLESLGITENPAETEDEMAIRDFRENVTFGKGRYSVSLPWNENVAELQSDYKLSLGRLNSLVKRLKDDPKLRETYDETIKGQLNKGVIEKVEQYRNKEANVHYIPHHAVVKPDSETTKVRIVFDGSAKTRKTCPSLNECLFRGPIILEDLVGMLLRFRLHKIALVSDIEKAFLQISIREEDRDYTRFLWLKDPKVSEVNGNIQEYRFARVPFGLNCSPSLLAQTVQYHLENNGTPVAKQILNDLYVDNVITGVRTVEQAKDFYVKSKDIFSNASMNLRSWCSNSQEFMKFVPSEDSTGQKAVKVLGMKWTTEDDRLNILGASSEKLNGVATKRDLLSAIASVFDPMGLFCPCTVRSKCLLQAVSKDKTSWDAKIPEKVLSEWSQENSNLEQIGAISVPRKIGFDGCHSLVAFSDASNSSFATTVYLRTTNGCQVETNLVFAKSRLNPAKKLTIPRLELMGVLIGVRALKFVESQLRLELYTTVLFCDSKVALAWVKDPKNADLFVKNRVKEIQKSERIQVRYVQTEQNPADWATRGKSSNELNSFWWNGPSWLNTDLGCWPDWDYSPFTIQKTAEVKCGEISMVTDETVISPPFDMEIGKYSTLNKVLRVTAWCLRFVRNTQKRNVPKGCISASEIADAKRRWDLHVQQKAYSKVKDAVAADRKHEMWHLGIFIDEEGLLRTKGRMTNAQLEWSVKFPKVMSKKDPYTSLLVWAAHAKCGHGSVNHTLCQLRTEYWVPKGRSLVQSVLKTCVICRRASGKAYGTPNMPELPASRVTPEACFVNTGVDYFGPVKVMNARKEVKAWVALFTCLSTRAVHLELVMDLTASEFLMALKRFISRRGQPKTMMCDNAPQFKLVASATEIAWKKAVGDPEITDFCADSGITWTFIPENAPFMGGIYERMVGIVKTCLRKIIGPALLSVKHFETFLCECESTVNSRPLVYVGGDVTNGVLTPSHFLSLNPKVATTDRMLQGENADFGKIQGSTAESLLREWKKGQKLLNEFWKLWSSEYLSALRERSQYLHKHKSRSPEIPKVGDVVLVKDQCAPRGSWKMGRISRLNESADKCIRSVFLQLSSGREVRRPVHLLIPLETSPTPAESQDNNGQTNHGIDGVDETSSGRASPEL